MSKRLSDDDLDRLEALAEGDKATDGVLADAEFVAAVRNALPALVAEVRVLRGQVAEALRIEAWPYKPATMTGYELDQADGYNDARREFRRALGVVSDD